MTTRWCLIDKDGDVVQEYEDRPDLDVLQRRLGSAAARSYSPYILVAVHDVLIVREVPASYIVDRQSPMHSYDGEKCNLEDHLAKIPKRRVVTRALNDQTEESQDTQPKQEHTADVVRDESEDVD